MASTLEINIEAAKKIVELYNKTPSWIEKSHDKDHEWKELPTEFTQEGYIGCFEDKKESALQVSQLLPDRKMEILNLVAGEPPRFFRRPGYLSQATMAVTSCC
jgi:hypothetical protein